MYWFIYCLKAFAAILITNSHFDRLYPNAALSIGGSLGNTIFFIVSGYCLSSKVDSTFLTWIKNRLLRIYPSLWIVSLGLIALGVIHIQNISSLMLALFYPLRTYWFIAAIILFYFIFYFIAKLDDEKVKVVFIFTLCVYFVLYFTTRDLSQWSIEGNDYFKYIFYFGVMLCGFILKKRNIVDKMLCHYSKLRQREIDCVAVLSLGLYLMLKLMLIKYPALYKVQFIVQGITLVFGVFTFLSFIQLEPLFSRLGIFCKAVIKGIGNSTLEIYLLNYVLADCFKNLLFPANVVFAFASIIVCGCILHTFIDKLTSWVYLRIITNRK